jgi:hypothetical protein
MKLSIPAGTTSKRIAIFIADSSSTTGAGLTGLTNASASLVCYSWIDTDGNVAGTSQALQAATRGTWTTRGFIEKDATNMPGWYEFGVPDALLAAGVKWAIIHLKGATNMAPLPIEIEVTATSNQDGTRGGMSALPNAAAEAAGGLYTRGTGAGQINQPANGMIDANLVRWLGTAASTPTVAGVPNVNVKTFNDLTAVALPLVPTTAGRTLDVAATGEAGLDFANVNLPAGSVPALGIVDSGTLQGATGTTAQLRAAASFADSRLIGMTILITGGTGVGQARVITAYTDATDTATVDAWTTTPDATSTYIVIGTAPASATALPTVLLSPGTGTGQVLLSAGQLTVGTNNDKSGYSLSQSFPANFASLSITAGGLVDITQAAADKVWGSATRTLTAISTALALSVWDVLEASIGTANSIGLKLKKFSFNGSNEVAANTESINNTPVLGTGGAADKWRG